MAFQQSDLDALEKAIATGARVVKQGDKEIQYGSLREMLTVRDLMRRELGIVSDAQTRIFPRFDKGIRR